MSDDKRIVKLKREVRSIILSSPRGLTINQFLKDYKDSIGQSFPFQELGYSSISDLFRDINDVVRLNPGYNGNESVLVPVVDDKVNHINKMISHQKLASNKSSRPAPRRCFKEDLSTKNINDNHSNIFDGSASFSSRTACEESNYNSSHISSQPPYDYQIPDPNVTCVDPSDQAPYKPSYGPDTYPLMLDDEFERPPTPGEMIINEKMKNNFRELLADYYPDGIPSSKFCKLYKEKFRVPLRYDDYGLNSFQELIAKLPDVFDFKQQRSSQQWILFDARKPLPPKESKKWIPHTISSAVMELALGFPDGLKKSEFVFQFRNRFDSDVEFKELGFHSIDAFLLCCTSITICNISGEEYIFAKNSYQTETTDNGQAYALPPVSEMPYLWGEQFSEYECNPSASYPLFHLIQDPKLEYENMVVCDVLSPCNLYLQMSKQREDLSKLMFNLNQYYDKFEQNHILSDPNIAAIGLLCAVRFSVDNRWHRAKILSHSDSNNVLVKYVDYGTENVVGINEVRKLHRDFLDMPVQSVQAALHGIIPKGSSSKWSSSANNYIYDLCFEKKFDVAIMKIDESIPKLYVVLYDCNNSLTINDQLLTAGYADVPVKKTGKTADLRARTPPGYSSLAVKPSPELITSASTCDRILVLRKECIEFHKEIEKLKNLIKQRILEADVLEQHVCKHHHPSEDYENISKFYVNENETIVKKEVNGNFDQKPIDVQPEGIQNVNFIHSTAPPAPMFNQGVNSYNHYQQQEFNPGMENEIHRYNQPPHSGAMLKHHQQDPPVMQPHMLNHPSYQQSSFPPFNQQMPHLIPNKMMQPSRVFQNQNPYTRHLMPCYQPPQNVYPHNIGQYVGWPLQPQVPTGIYGSYQPEMYSAKPPLVRPTFNRSPANNSYNFGVEPMNMPPLCSTNKTTQLLSDNFAPSAPAEEILHVDSSSSLTTDKPLNCQAESAEVIEEHKDTLATPNHPPSCSIDTSHLTEKQAKKLENTEDIKLYAPISNNWSELLPSSIPASQNTTPPPGRCLCPNQTALNLLKEEKPIDDGLEVESKEVDDDFTDAIVQEKEAVNHIMKICVENIKGMSSNILLLLVGDAVAVLLNQLYELYLSIDSFNDEFDMENQLKIKDNIPAYSILYSDYVPIFDKLREESFINDDDPYISVVNLCDVPAVLDVICPVQQKNLHRIKDIFMDLSKLVLPIDQFWFTNERIVST